MEKIKNIKNKYLALLHNSKIGDNSYEILLFGLKFLPDITKFEKDVELAEFFFVLSENLSWNKSERDFALELSVYCRGIDTGPLMNYSPDRITNDFISKNKGIYR